jgi:hypothetical protein
MAERANDASAKNAAKPRLNWLRTALIGLLIFVGCLASGAYVVVHWTEDKVLTTDHWVALISPLPKEAVVSNTLGSYISDTVFAEAPVEQAISDALPPRAAFLASPLAGQLHTLTTKAAQKLVASDGFQTIWVAANRIAMTHILADARGQKVPARGKLSEKFNLNLSNVSGQLGSVLGSASSAIPALQPASKTAINVSTDLHTRPHRLRQIVQAIDFSAIVLPLVFTACFLTALAVSLRRRHTSIVIAISLLIVMLVELIALKAGRQEVLNQVQHPANLAAVSFIFDALVAGLKQLIDTVLISLLFILGICFALGPADWAVKLRVLTRLDRWNGSDAQNWWTGARIWVRQWQYYIWLAIFIAVLAAMALLVNVGSRSVTNAVLLAISLFAMVHIIATPRRTGKSQAK